MIAVLLLTDPVMGLAFIALVPGTKMPMPERPRAPASLLSREPLPPEVHIRRSTHAGGTTAVIVPLLVAPLLRLMQSFGVVPSMGGLALASAQSAATDDGIAPVNGAAAELVASNAPRKAPSFKAHSRHRRPPPAESETPTTCA